MTVDKQKLQSLLWSEVAAWKADCAEWKRNTEALQEFLGEKTVEEVALELLEELENFKAEVPKWTEREIKLIAESEKLKVDLREVKDAKLGLSWALGEIMGERDKLKAEIEALSSAVENLERSRVSGFEEYDFTRLKGRAGAEKVFEITIETECGCDIAEGEYTVRVTHLLGNWLGEDDFGLIKEAVAEVIADLTLPEEGHTTFIAYESGERQDVFWTKWFEIATVESALVEVVA